jgi:hypothetical protein
MSIQEKSQIMMEELMEWTMHMMENFHQTWKMHPLHLLVKKKKKARPREKIVWPTPLELTDKNHF